MRRRTGLAGLVAAVVVAVGVVAGPAAADPPGNTNAPLFRATASCDLVGGSSLATFSIDYAGRAQQYAVAGLNKHLHASGERCVPGTKTVTVEKLP